MADAVNILRRAKFADKAPLFEPYSKVIIHAGLSSDGKTEVIYTAGNDSGRTLEVNNEWGTQQMANTILAKIGGYQYQPFQARQALIDPSVELGDGITVNGIYSGIFVQSTTFNALMESDVSAPVDEEIEHEYGFESQTNRAFTRMVAQTRSGITQNANEISSEVTRLEKYIDDENNEQTRDLQSEISQTATSIKATVASSQKQYDTTEYTITLYGYGVPDTEAYPPRSYNGKYYLNQSNGKLYLSNGASWNYVKDLQLISTKQQAAIDINSGAIAAKVSKEGGVRTSFGWEMNDTSHTWYANNQEIVRMQKSGLTVTGEIRATSGYIGGSTGFEIKSNYIANGMSGRDDTTKNGIYLGIDGIALGKGNFKVTSQGELTAKYGNIGGFTITSSNLYNGKDGRDADTKAGVYVGTNGIALGNGSANHTFKVTNAGAMTVKYGMTSLNDTTNSGVYIGTDGIALGAGNFKVTTRGELTAKSGTIGGLSINASSMYTNNQSDFNGTGEGVHVSQYGLRLGGTFKVTKAGKVTASDLAITGGTISIKDGNGNVAFSVSNRGAVSASNLAITGGSISIKDGDNNVAFSVTNMGKVTAKDISITGGSISIKDGNGNVFFQIDPTSGASGSFFVGSTAAGYILSENNGRGLGWIEGGAYGQIKEYSVLGGQGGQIGYTNHGGLIGGNLEYSTISTDYTSLGINTSLGYANFADDVFNARNTATYVKCQYLVDTSGYHYGPVSLTIDGTSYRFFAWSGGSPD